MEICRFNSASDDSFRSMIHIQIIAVVVWCQGRKLIRLIVSLSYVTSWRNLMAWGYVMVAESLAGEQGWLAVESAAKFTCTVAFGYVIASWIA